MCILLYRPILLASVVFTCAYEVGSPTDVAFVWICSSNCCRWWLCLWDLLLLLESAVHGRLLFFQLVQVVLVRLEVADFAEDGCPRKNNGSGAFAQQNVSCN